MLAGAAVAVGLWMVLQMLGMGIGLAAVDTDDAGSLRGVGIGTTVWSLITPIVSLFVGGFVAGRLAQTYDKHTRVMHGGVVWALTAILGTLALMTIVDKVASNAVRAGSAVANVAGDAVSSAAGGIDKDTFDGLGISADDMIAPINQRLRAQGKPEVKADEIEDAAKAALRTSVRKGSFDRDTFVSQLAAKTQLSRTEAEDVARQIEARYEQARAKVADVGDKAKGYALEAADKTGKALLAVSMSLLLGLVSAIVGSLLALRRRDRDDDRGARVTTTTIDPVNRPFE